MKRLILASLVAAAVVNSYGQGAIDVGNNFGASVFRAPIWGVETPDPTVSKTGNAGAPAFPAGSQTYTGTRLTGTGFTFGFYASTTGITADANSLSLIGTLTFGSGGTAGFVTTTTMNVPGVTAGNATTWQIRAWDNAGGTINSFANAAIRGASALVNSGPLGGIGTGGPVSNPSTATGWSSFNIYAVPEPSSFLLAGLGAAGLLIFRRRK
jgi:hypothetical protein